MANNELIEKAKKWCDQRAERPCRPSCLAGFAEAYAAEVLKAERGDALRVERLQNIVEMIYQDPHQWSSRPCDTCKHIGVLLGQTFGCYRYQENKNEFNN